MIVYRLHGEFRGTVDLGTVGFVKKTSEMETNPYCGMADVLQRKQLDKRRD